MYNWDAGLEGWTGGEGSGAVFHDTAVSRNGAGSLRLESVIDAPTGQMNMGANGPSNPGLSDGDVFGVWIYIASDILSATYRGMLRIMYGSGPYAWGHVHSDYVNVTPGVWTYIEMDLSRTNYANTPGESVHNIVASDITRIEVRAQANSVDTPGTFVAYFDDMAIDQPVVSEPKIPIDRFTERFTAPNGPDWPGDWSHGQLVGSAGFPGGLFSPIEHVLNGEGVAAATPLSLNWALNRHMAGDSVALLAEHRVKFWSSGPDILPVVHGSGNNTDGGGTTVTLTWDSKPALNTYLLCVVTFTGTPTINREDSNWAVLNNTTETNTLANGMMRSVAYWKRATANEPLTHTFTFSLASIAAVTAVGYSNVVSSGLGHQDTKYRTSDVQVTDLGPPGQSLTDTANRIVTLAGLDVATTLTPGNVNVNKQGEETPSGSALGSSLRPTSYISDRYQGWQGTDDVWYAGNMQSVSQHAARHIITCISLIPQGTFGPGLIFGDNGEGSFFRASLGFYIKSTSTRFVYELTLEKVTPTAITDLASPATGGFVNDKRFPFHLAVRITPGTTAGHNIHLKLWRDDVPEPAWDAVAGTNYYISRVDNVEGLSEGFYGLSEHSRHVTDQYVVIYDDYEVRPRSPLSMFIGGKPIHAVKIADTDVDNVYVNDKLVTS